MWSRLWLWGCPTTFTYLRFVHVVRVARKMDFMDHESFHSVVFVIDLQDKI